MNSQLSKFFSDQFPKDFSIPSLLKELSEEVVFFTTGGFGVALLLWSAL